MNSPVPNDSLTQDLPVDSLVNNIFHMECQEVDLLGNYQ